MTSGIGSSTLRGDLRNPAAERPLMETPKLRMKSKVPFNMYIYIYINWKTTRTVPTIDIFWIILGTRYILLNLFLKALPPSTSRSIDGRRVHRSTGRPSMRLDIMPPPWMCFTFCWFGFAFCLHVQLIQHILHNT